MVSARSSCCRLKRQKSDVLNSPRLDSHRIDPGLVRVQVHRNRQLDVRPPKAWLHLSGARC